MNLDFSIADSPELGANIFLLCKRIGDRLHLLYPGHLWAAWPASGSGHRMLDVRNFGLSGNWGFRIDLDVVYSSSELDRIVMRAGGELLEHYKQARGAINWDKIMDLPVDVAGNHKPDL